MNPYREKLSEALSSVLPISGIVLLLSLTLTPLDAGAAVLFLFGALLMIGGMVFFTLGSGMSMQPLGEGIGASMSRTRHLYIPLVTCLLLGFIITIAEPDLQVLARQVPSVPDRTLIFSVAAGVGLFLMIAMLRMIFGMPLSRLLLIFYGLILLLALFAPKDFIPAAFDAGGVTTGPVTVPFIMAFGAGMAAVRSDKRSEEDSFGLVALCSVGPILSVLILSIGFRPEATATSAVLAEIRTTRDAMHVFYEGLQVCEREVLAAMLPLIGLFVLFQLISRRFHKNQILRILMGMLYTYVGLVFFLTGANVGFMPAGQLIGASIASGPVPAALIPVGMLIGYFIVAAEPAVIVLKKQVEEVSNGAITQKSIGIGLSIGVAFSVGIAMLRVLTGIPLLPIVAVGYMLSLGISFFVPPLYTGVAFDAGGVASGPMTTTFVLPFAMGACEALGGNVMADAFGVVAMVAVTPLITIQTIGLFSRIRQKRRRRRMDEEFALLDDGILYFDEEREEAVQ